MILRHRDRELLRFEWIGARGVRVLSVNDAERKFLPIEMAGTASDESLWKWLSHRVAPISRTNIQDPIDDSRFANVFLFDALFFNTDRHMGNFGYLVDNDTNEIVDAAPISANVGTINPDQGQDSLKAAIIENIRADSYATQEELCDILEVTRSVLTKAMTQLQAEGQLLRVGSRKTGYWQVND